MSSFRISLLILISSLLLFSGCSSGGTVYADKITDVDGIIRECGEGPGLEPCRDADGNTFEEDANPDAYFGTESNEQLEKDAERMRNQTPEEFEQTTEELEHEQWSQQD